MNVLSPFNQSVFSIRITLTNILKFYGKQLPHRLPPRSHHPGSDFQVSRVGEDRLELVHQDDLTPDFRLLPDPQLHSQLVGVDLVSGQDIQVDPVVDSRDSQHPVLDDLAVQGAENLDLRPVWRDAKFLVLTGFWD